MNAPGVRALEDYSNRNSTTHMSTLLATEAGRTSSYRLRKRWADSRLHVDGATESRKLRKATGTNKEDGQAEA